MRRSAISFDPDITCPLASQTFAPAINSEFANVGADVYEIYPVVDAIAREYEFAGGDAA